MIIKLIFKKRIVMSQMIIYAPPILSLKTKKKSCFCLHALILMALHKSYAGARIYYVRILYQNVKVHKSHIRVRVYITHSRKHRPTHMRAPTYTLSYA